ncbi:MAG: archease [Actinobacteria bacterium]|nr:archease [Actinomycetota bacterium]
MSLGFELVDHTADIGVRVWGPTAAEVFEEAGRALFSLVCDPLREGELEEVELELEAEAADLLLAAWLNELLYLFEARQLVLTEFEVRELGERRLRARVAGEPLDVGRHIMCGGVKAATLHELRLEQRSAGWEGFVVLDV